MALTPFHLGPATLIAAVAGRRLDAPTLLVGSVILDVRAMLVVFGPLGGPRHGVPTTFLGGAVVAALLAAVVVRLRRPVRVAWRAFGDDSPPSPARVVAAAFVGVWSHVVLDAALYADVQPFYPLAGNPFGPGVVGVRWVYLGCLAAGLLGVPLLGIRCYRWYRTDDGPVATLVRTR